MAHFPLPRPGSCAAQARQATAELAMAARHGAIGAGTVLSYTARIERLLHTLAACEEAMDDEVEDARRVELAREEALAAGTVIPLPARRARTTTGGGGRAA
jgi:hypothetical protein